MQGSMARHSPRPAVESTLRLASPGCGVAVFVSATGSDGVSDESVSDESDNAAVTIGSGFCAAGVASATFGSAVGLLAIATSAVTTAIGCVLSARLDCEAGIASETTGSVTGRLAITTSAVWAAIGCLSTKLASAVRDGTTPTMMGAAPEPNATSHTRTEAGSATSRHNVAIVVKCGFMITVSLWAGCDADDCWSRDLAKQWRNARIFRFQQECCLN